MLVRLPPPYDFDLSVERFRAFGDDLLYRWRDGALHRVLAGREVRLRAARAGVEVEPADGALAGPVGRLLGASFDLDGFRHVASADPVLGPLERRLRGFRPPLTPHPLEHLVSSISAQQVSLRAALAVRNRLVVRLAGAAGHAYRFPSRERLAAVTPAELREVGFSMRKAEAIVAIARSDVDLEALATLPDVEVVERLRELPGIGEWTAEWFLARHLGRPDVWPAGDLGLRKAASHFLGDGRVLSIAETRALGERFAPHRTVAAHYLLTGMRVHA